MVGMVVLSVYVFSNLTQLSRDVKETTGFNTENPPKEHLMVIIDGSDDNYVDDIERGIKEAAENEQVVYELWAPSKDDIIEEILIQFDIGIESDVDGIAVQAFEDERFQTLIKKANDKKIPIVTIGEDIVSEDKVSHLSYNHYAVGAKIGKLLRQRLEEKAILKGTIVLLEDEKSDNQEKSFGIKENLPNGVEIQLGQVEYHGVDTLNAEGATRHILSRYNDLIGIVCSNGEETLGVVQALKDMNKINDVIVIGSDDSPEIIDFIERGVIFSTVISDNRRLGYEVVDDLAKYLKGDFVSYYKDIQVSILVREDIAAYKREAGDYIE